MVYRLLVCIRLLDDFICFIYFFFGEFKGIKFFVKSDDRSSR